MLDQGKKSYTVSLIRSTLLLILRVLFRIEHFGYERVPSQGPLMIAANHVTYFDPFWIAVRIYRKVRFMAWDKIFRIPLAGSIFRWFGAFPVSLVNPEVSSYRSALKILLAKEALMIFPEGGRSSDGKLLPFKGGMAKLALRSGATILPVVVSGGERVWRRGMLLPLPRKVTVHFLEPICPDQFANSPEELTDQVRNAILCQQNSHT